MVTLHRATWVMDAPKPKNLRAHQKGALAVSEKGQVTAVGTYSSLKKVFPRAKTIDHGEALITPGFVDCHVHGPQLGVTSAFGADLVDWLTRYTFPIESKFNDLKYAKKHYQAFAKCILSHGTTSAAVYGTSSVGATEILAKVLQKSGIRAYVGPSLMDQNAPENLLVPINKALNGLEKLIKTLGIKSLVQPSVVVRFAPTSSLGLLNEVRDFIKRYPDILIQTHLSETHGEIAWVKKLFPKAKSYTHLYDEFGLLSEKTILGHGIHLSKEELKLLHHRGARIAHCPQSNLFLGSGLFDLSRAAAAGVVVGLGSDVGGGWTLSMSQTAASCYQVQALNGTFYSASELLYLITRGGALSLGSSNVGAFDAGMEADFVVHRLSNEKNLEQRLATAESADEILAAFLFLSTRRCVERVYVAGHRVI